MAFPTTFILDDFTRAALGSNYTVDPLRFSAAPPTLTGGAFSTGAATYTDVWWNVSGSYGPDVESFGTINAFPTVAGTNGFWLRARLVQPSSASSTADGYEVDVIAKTGATPEDIIYFEIANTVQTQMGAIDAPLNWSVGDGFGFEARGQSLNLYRRDSTGTWTLIDTRTDPTYTSAGFLSFGLTDSASGPGRFDNFGGGTTVAPRDRVYAEFPKPKLRVATAVAT